MKRKHKLSKTVADHQIEVSLFKRTGDVLATHDEKDADLMSLLSANFLTATQRRTLQARWGV